MYRASDNYDRSAFVTDFIHYRLPGSSTVARASGKFSLLENGLPPRGIVVTDFLHQQVYQFEERKSETFELHTLDAAPVVISKRDYQIEAQAMLHAFQVYGVQKAVYSRVKAVSFPIEKALSLFKELEKTYPSAFVYLLTSELLGTWIGASPEVLVNVEDGILRTVALAGTQSGNESGEWGEKEFMEHQYVVDAIEQTLMRNKCTILEEKGPETVTAGPVRHLKTQFKATTGQTAPWAIAMDLHPTPAVCGTPRMQALDLLLSREMHERSLYTGAIGLYTETTAHLFVNLRCAQLQKTKAYLYLGGGFTADSIPDLEWEETENKARTLLDCMEKL